MPSLLALRFTLENGQTILRIAYQDPPWKVVRAFHLPNAQTLVHLNNVSGGILGGDDLELHIHLAPGASALITTTGATRVYKSETPARTVTHIHQSENTLLELLPDPLIPFAHSRYEQQTHIHLEPHATLFAWETLAPGRAASGELFAYHSLTIETQIHSAQTPILLERFHLDPTQRPLTSPGRLGDHLYLASLYVCQTGQPQHPWLDLEAALRPDPAAEDEVRWGVSALPQDGLVIRGTTRQGHLLPAALQEFWKKAKLHLTGQAAIPPRKVP